MADDPFPILPHDVKTEAMLCLPVESIYQLRTLSKGWNSFLSHRDFLRQYAKRHFGKELEKLVCVGEDSRLYELTCGGGDGGQSTWRRLNSPVFEGSKLSGSCRGLVLLRIRVADEWSLVVFNPLTMESITVPPSELALERRNRGFVDSMYGLGYSEAADDFYVVCLSRFTDENKYYGSESSEDEIDMDEDDDGDEVEDEGEAGEEMIEDEPEDDDHAVTETNDDDMDEDEEVEDDDAGAGMEGKIEDDADAKGKTEEGALEIDTFVDYFSLKHKEWVRLPSLYPFYFFDEHISPGLFVGDSLHWMVFDKQKRGRDVNHTTYVDPKVIVLNMNTLEFNVIKIPGLPSLCRLGAMGNNLMLDTGNSLVVLLHHKSFRKYLQFPNQDCKLISYRVAASRLGNEELSREWWFSGNDELVVVKRFGGSSRLVLWYVKDGRGEARPLLFQGIPAVDLYNLVAFRTSLESPSY